MILPKLGRLVFEVCLGGGEFGGDVEDLLPQQEAGFVLWLLQQTGSKGKYLRPLYTDRPLKFLCSTAWLSSWMRP